ncbi:MAG: hypothetical protein ACN0LA_09965 [Candidatus Longimicrobiales bacterium M2_2A_002]
MDTKTENLIVAAQRLAAMGLSDTYARFQLQKHADRLEEEAPETVAQSIYDSAEEEWKSGGGADGGGGSKKSDDDYDPVAEGKRLAAKQKGDAHGGNALAFT